MITYREERDIDLERLAALRAACGFAAQPLETLRRQIDGSRWVVSAWDGDRLVGFARAISDGVSTAYVSSVMVDASFRRRGIGRDMLGLLMRDRDGVKFVLHTRPDARAFYGALGFAEAADMMVRPRRTASIAHPL